MAEFLTALHWLRVLVAQFRWHPDIDGGIPRQAHGPDEANHTGSTDQRGREGCAGCRYYVATHGACHVQPPVQRDFNRPWRAVQPDDWCGAFLPAFGDGA